MPAPVFIAKVGTNPTNRSALGRFLCECGQAFVANVSNVKTNHTKSCGCLRRKRARDTIVSRNLRHGEARAHALTPEYTSWYGMLRRCRSPSTSNYARYGGLGVTVCERWNIYENFLADMGRRPSLNHSIDRIDPFGNYEKANCRWATRSQQSANQRRWRPKK